MVTLVAVVSLVSFTGAFGTGGAFEGDQSSIFRLLLPILACAVLPWTAWLDLSGWAESGARTPFLSAVLYSISAPVYFGTMAHNMEVVIALGAGQPGAVRFLGEFLVMLYSPLALMLAPCIRISVLAGPNRVRGARPSSNLIDFTAIRMYQALGVLMIGVMSFTYVLSSAVGGITEFSDAAGAGAWRQTVPIMVPIWWVGGIFSMFALAWGQFGHGLPGEQRISNS